MGWETLKGAQPPSPLYILEVLGLPTHENFSSWCSPTSLPTPPLPWCLAKPCWIATLLHHHHAVVLLLDGDFPNPIKAWETSPGCTCVERGGTVLRCLDRNQPRSESLRVRLLHPRSCNASASRSTMVCRCTPLPLYILEVFGAAIHTRWSLSWRSPTSLPPPLPRFLAKPCRIATLLHHHHAVVLLLDGVFPNLSFSPCWIKA